jgi:hypothetical protein
MFIDFRLFFILISNKIIIFILPSYHLLIYCWILVFWTPIYFNVSYLFLTNYSALIFNKQRSLFYNYWTEFYSVILFIILSNTKSSTLSLLRSIFFVYSPILDLFYPLSLIENTDNDFLSFKLLFAICIVFLSSLDTLSWAWCPFYMYWTNG